jgi:voltage-gated potassium channel Kch
MLVNLVFGTLVISATVVIHTLGLMAVTHLVGDFTSRFRMHGRRSRILAMLTVVIGTFALLTVEVWLWAIVYFLLGVVGDFATALYFSTVTFSTLGYGDVVPAADWRLFSALEAVNGFLLIGWSTAYLIAAGIRVGPFRAGEHF